MATVDYTIPDIEGVLQKLDGEVKKVTISRLTAPGENVSCLVFKMDVEVQKNGTTKTVNTVLKRLPVAEFDMKMNAIPMRNEIIFYTEVLPFIKDFARENGIDCSFYPEYVGSRFSLDNTKRECDKEAVLVMENLITEGYSMWDRHVGFDLVEAKSLLRTLATFHATPLVIKYKQPELFQKLADFFKTATPPQPPNRQGGGPGKRPSPLERIIDMPKLSQYKDQMLAVRNKPMTMHWFDENGKEPWLTLGHNDFWLNNMMLKKVEGADEPKVKMVDFQFGTYISYAKDLVFFLLTSVVDSIQREHFDELLRHYYNEFTAVLKKANSPHLDLSYEDYLKEVKRVAEEAEIRHAMMFTGHIFGPKNVNIDFLAGEGSREEHFNEMTKQENPRQIEKLLCIFEVATKQGWI